MKKQLHDDLYSAYKSDGCETGYNESDIEDEETEAI
jgi:hypothetical protein